MNEHDRRRLAAHESFDDRRGAGAPEVPNAADSGIYLTLDGLERTSPRREAHPQGWRELLWRWRVSASPVPMLIFVRATGAIVAANEAAAQAYGWTHEELLQASIADLVPPTDRFIDRLLRHSHHAVTWTEPLLHHRKDGTTFWAELGMLEAGVTDSATMAVVVKVREPHLDEPGPFAFEGA